jgi:DNA-binding transcriptional LysR family regulator
MGFKELGIFLEVVRAGSITGAADKLGMAKSAVSTQLKGLEDNLGLVLLSRSSRQLALTQEGQRLMPQIESLIAEAGRLFEVSEQQVAEPAGIVRMAGTPDLGSMIVKTLAPRLKEQYPELTLVTTLKYQFENLQDPFFDFAVRVGRVKDDNLVARPLGSFRRIAVASPDYLKRYPLNHPAELADHQCLLFSGSSNQSLWNFEQCKGSEQINVAVTGVLSMHSFSTLAELAAEGMGVATIPDFVAAPLIQRGQLKACLPNWFSRKADTYLAYRFGAEKINRIKVVIDFMREHIPNLFENNNINSKN